MTRRTSDVAGRRPSVPLLYLLLIVVLSNVATAGVALWVADRTARQGEQRWCGLVTTLDDTYRQAPPATETGRQVAVQIARLRTEFHCPLRHL